MTGRYTHGHHESVLRSHGWRTAENSAAHLLPHLRPGLDLLDVGCGPGTITVDLARLVAPGRVVAVDSAATAVSATRELAAQAGLPIEVRIDDAYRLGESDDCFDVVHAHQVLQHLADPVAALAEWRRVCRPGGIVAVRDADYSAMSWWPRDPRLDRWMALYQQAARANGGEPDAGRRLVSWVRAAGFTRVEATASAWAFATPADRTWWADTWAARITSSALAEQLLASGAASQDELDGIAAAFTAWRDADDGWFAILHADVIASA